MGKKIEKGLIKMTCPFLYFAVAPAARLLASACLLAATTQSSDKMRGPGRSQTLQKYKIFHSPQHLYKNYSAPTDRASLRDAVGLAKKLLPDHQFLGHLTHGDEIHSRR